MAKKNAKSGNNGNNGNNGKAVGQDQAGREIDGSNRSDILIGSRRDDVINGRGGSDLIIGGNGNDQISGGRGSDLLLGGNGDDVINGGRGSDTLIGGSGDDTLNGGAGNDLLIGGGGNDVFNGGAGNDTIVGGGGENTVILSGSVRDYAVEMGRRSVTVSGEDGTDTLSGIEVLSFDDATVYLDGRNNGPLLDSDVNAGIEENGTSTINALAHAFDFDGDTLTLVSVDAGDFAGLMRFDPATGEITLDPGSAYDSLVEGEVVTFTLSYTVTDGTDTSTGEMTVQITGSNDAPVVTPIDAGPVSEDGGLLSVDLMATASDVDTGDTIGIEEIQSVTSSNPARSIVWGLDPNNYDAVQLDLNQFTDLQEGETETVTIAYVVGDNRGGLTTNTATFTVVGTNDLPTYVDFTTWVSEDSPLWVNLLASVEDVDSDTVVATDVVAFSSNPDRPITANVDLEAGTVIFPSGQFEDLAEGQTETLTITFNLDDGDGGIVPRELSFTVVGQNDAPVVTPIDAGPVSEDGGLLSVDLMATASDVDTGDTIGIEEIQSVTSSNPARSIVWGLDPNNYDAVQLDLNQFTDLQEGETETVTIAYVVGDNRGGLTTNTATFTVVGTNDLPTYVDFTTSVSEDSPLWVNLLASVEDVDSDTVVATDVVAFSSNPDRPITANVDLEAGTVIFPSGQFEDLAEGQTETLTITFNLDDGDGGIVPRELSFTVVGQNDAPVVTPIDAGPVSEDGGLLSVDLMATASDVDTGDTIGIDQIQSVTSSNPARSIVWGLDPNNYDAVQLDLNQFTDLQEGETETVTITYVVGDNRGGLTTNTATFTVVGTNDLPTYVDFTMSLGESEPLWVNLLASVEDVDSDTVIVTDVATFTSNPDRVVTANVNLEEGTVTFPYGQFEDLREGEVEILTITFNLDDGDGGIVPRQLNFTVIGQNDAPYIEPWNSSLEATLDENDAPTLVTAGTIAFEDVDNGDWQQGGFTGLTLSGNAGDLNPNNLYGLLRLDDFAQDGTLGWVFTADSGLFDYLQEGESVTLTYDVEITDGRASDTTQVSITIEGTNDLPTFVDFTLSLGESEPLWVNLLASVEDVDSDTVTVTDVVAFTNNPDRVVTANVNLEEGTVTFPYGQYEDLAEGETEILTISFNLDDGDGGIVARELYFTVVGQNDVPYIEPWNSQLDGTIDENDAATLTTSGTVVFDDPDASDYHYGSVTGVNLSGTVGDLNAGSMMWLLNLSDGEPGASLNWTFAADSSAFDYLQEGESVTLTYAVDVNDDYSTASTTVSVTIEGTNDLPTFVDFGHEIDETTSLWVNLLGSVHDVDSDNVTIRDVVAHTNNPDRVVALDVNLEAGTVLFPYGQYEDLAEGESEILTISYTIDDGDGGVVPAEMNFTVIGSNDVPYFEPWNSELDASAEATGDGQLTASGVIGISDPDASDTHTGTALSVVLSGDVGDLTEADVLGLLSFDSSAPGASVAWSFDSASSLFAQLSGSLTLTYEVEVSDGHDSVTAPVTITITPQNAAPDFDVSMNEDSFFVYVDMLEGASDADGDSLSVSNVVITTSNPDRFFAYSLDESNGQFTVYPGNFQDLSAGETETVTLTYDVTDGQGGVTPRTVTITVDGANDAVSSYDSAFVIIGENDSPDLSTSGSIEYYDVDTGDSHTTPISSVLASGQTSGLAGVDLASFLTLDAEDGIMSWSFDAPGSVFDYLNDGETVMINYYVDISDGASSVRTPITVMITGATDAASMKTQVFSKSEPFEVDKVPVSDDLADTDADGGLVSLSHDDALAVMTGADVAEFSFDRVFDLTNFSGTAQFASLTETGEAGTELDSVQPTLGQSDAFDLPGLDAFGLPQDDAALALPVPDMPEGW